jgi:Stress responsive A/B Barrel Domain
VIVHVILYKPRTDLADDMRQQIVEGLATAATAIPSIRRLRVGKRVKHRRPGYEQAMPTDFEYAVIVEFDDVDGLTAYLAHPAHNAIGGHFTASASDSLAYDYEMVDLASR